MCRVRSSDPAKGNRSRCVTSSQSSSLIAGFTGVAGVDRPRRREADRAFGTRRDVVPDRRGGPLRLVVEEVQREIHRPLEPDAAVAESAEGAREQTLCRRVTSSPSNRRTPDCSGCATRSCDAGRSHLVFLQLVFTSVPLPKSAAESREPHR